MKTIQILKSKFSTILNSKSWFRGKNFAGKTAGVIAESRETATQANTLVKAAPKPPRALTPNDIWNFRQYVLSKKFELKISPNEIKALFAKEGEELKTGAFEFLCEKMNIPQELKPHLNYGTELKQAMAYILPANTININPNFKNELENKTVYFVSLRHELQHFYQNMQMYRHETKGQKLIETYARKIAKQSRISIEDSIKNADLEYLKSMSRDREHAEMLMLKLLEKNSPKQYDYAMQSLEEQFYNTTLAEHTQFRKTVIEKLGIIKENSPEGKRAEKMFDKTVSEISYWKSDGTVDISRYLGDLREVEALCVQDAMTILLNNFLSNNDKYCYLRTAKEIQENLLKNKDKLKPEFQEILNTEKINNDEIKKGISYIFD